MSFFSKLFSKKQDSQPAATNSNAAREDAAEKANLYGEGVPLLEIPKPNGGTRYELDMRPHDLYGMFTIHLPADWEPFESDRFRAKTADGATQVSIMLYAQNGAPEVLDADFFLHTGMGMYRRFVHEGGYEPYNDLSVTDHFICHSFKVDDETQYYLTTAGEHNGQTVMANIIIRDVGEYNPKLRAVIQAICNGISKHL